MIFSNESMEWISVKTVIFILSTAHARTPTPGVSAPRATSLTPGVCLDYRRIKSVDGSYRNVKITICCHHFEERNGICVECQKGFFSKGKVCTKCVNSYGYKCIKTCNCNSTERCHHEKGCVPIDDKAATVVTPDKKPRNSIQEADNNVVTYMTCVAVGSVLVVVCGLIVKNREAICQRKSSKAMTTEITKRKRFNFGLGKENVKDKKESLYADINEKYMLNFDGE